MCPPAEHTCQPCLPQSSRSVQQASRRPHQLPRPAGEQVDLLCPLAACHRSALHGPDPQRAGPVNKGAPVLHIIRRYSESAGCSAPMSNLTTATSTQQSSSCKCQQHSDCDSWSVPGAGAEGARSREPVLTAAPSPAWHSGPTATPALHIHKRISDVAVDCWQAGLEHAWLLLEKASAAQ